MQKLFLLFSSLFVFLLSCQNPSDSKKEKITKDEKTELKKVETLKKTDKEREDSVMAKWQAKMEKSKVGE